MAKGFVRLTVPSENDGERLEASLWEPEGEPVAIVQIVHGMREHMGRYHAFAAFLNTQGILVCGHDHMGHGRHITANRTFGHFGDEGGAKRLVRDTHQITKYLRSHYPGTPLFLLGFSMGSFIGRLYVLHYASELSGFICMGTGGEVKAAPYGRALAEAALRTQGPKADARMLHRLTFRDYNRRFTLESSPMAWLSRDPDTVQAFTDDPLIQPYFTNSGFRDFLDVQIAVTGREWYRRVDKSLPILLTSGREDPVGDYGKGVVQVYERLKMVGALHVECKLYDGARHELLGELNREEVFFDVYSWIRRNLY